MAHVIPEGLGNLLAPILVIIGVTILDWRMGLLSLVTIPAGVIAMMYMMKIGLKKMPDYYAAGANLNNTVVEYVSGMEVIKIFGQTTSSFKKYGDAVENYKMFTLDWYKACWKSMAVTYSVLPCTVLLTLPLGVVFYLDGSLELSTWIMILLLDLSLSTPLTKVINFIPMFPQVGHTLKTIESMFDVPDVQSGGRTENPESYDVAFSGVTFAYKEKDVVKNMSFTAKQNHLTALVGESGSGKSTLAKLLVHYWDVKDGSVSIGGVNIREYTYDTLMGLTSYVAQDTFLFTGTIGENIAMGKHGASQVEIENAAKAASCHDFIMSLENGYDTSVGGLGSKLSGGEKQRITIARAILKDAPIIILDEATAFADAENEDLIKEAVGKLIKNKTLIVIAHRLGTIRNADKIIVLGGGEIICEGTHDELMKNSDVYKNLWEKSELAENWNVRAGV